VKGKMATGQCDGWKNIAKTSLVLMVMIPYLIETHNITHDPKTGNILFKLILQDIKIMEEVYDIIVIVWCTDNGLYARKMHHLLLAYSPWLIILPCWAHQ
ncbi:hypothetical protein BDN70DRAFT_767378, partial [Pholiota conissans]